MVAWAAFAVLVDESPDPRIDRFLGPTRPAVADERNAALALAGVAAPSGGDPIEHGRFVVKTIWEAYYVNREPWTRTQEKINFPGTLKLKLGGDALGCWVDPALARFHGKCASEAEVRAMLAEDAELISRYQRAIALPEFSGRLYNGVFFLDLNKALVAQVRLDLKDGRPAIALSRWRANQEFVARALKSQGTWVDKAILLVAQGTGFQALEAILQQRFPIAEREYETLERLLRPEGLVAYDVEGTLRAEYDMFRPIFEPPAEVKFWIHREFIRNRFHRFSAAFAEAGKAPPGEMERAFDRVERDHVRGWSIDYLFDPLNAFYVRALLGGQLRAWEMLKQMHLLEGHKGLLALRLEIHRRKLADHEIPALLARSELREPYSGQPMKWNAEKRTIYFAIPGESGAVREVYL